MFYRLFRSDCFAYRFHWTHLVRYKRLHVIAQNKFKPSVLSIRDVKWNLVLALRRPVRRADSLTTFMCADCLEIWEPRVIEPPGPAQASTGIALPLPSYACS